MNSILSSAGRKRLQYDILQAAVFLAYKLGSIAGYDILRKKLEHHRRASSKTLKPKRHPIKEQSKRSNLRVIKQTSSESLKDGRQLLRVIESVGGMPVIYKTDKTFGYIKNRSLCMVPIKEGEDEDNDVGQPFHLSIVTWPFYYNQSDLAVYNNKVYTKSFFTKKKQRKQTNRTNKRQKLSNGCRFA
jgi:hypothetical protein